MASQRKAIRAEIVTCLKAGGTIAGQNVFPDRSRKIFDEEIPCILVYTKSETAAISGSSPQEYKRDLTVFLELVMQGNREEIIDDLLDDFCDSVEQIIFDNDNFRGEVSSDVMISDTEIEILAEEGKKITAGAKITLTFPYYQFLPGDRSDELDDFDSAVITTQIEGETDDNEAAVDELDLEDQT